MHQYLYIALFHLLFRGFVFVSELGAQTLYIDHVIIAVDSLEDEIKFMEQRGFTVKPGHKHENALHNAHIKFQNTSSIELMGLWKKPEDTTAKEYAHFLAEANGPIYIALTGIPLTQVAILLEKKQIEFKEIPGKLWSYIVFPENSALSSLFFIEYHQSFKDTKQQFAHKNGANQIKVVYLQSNPAFNALFSIFSPNVSSFNSTFEYPTKTGLIECKKGPKEANSGVISSVVVSDALGNVVYQWQHVKK